MINADWWPSEWRLILHIFKPICFKSAQILKPIRMLVTTFFSYISRYIPYLYTHKIWRKLKDTFVHRPTRPVPSNQMLALSKIKKEKISYQTFSKKHVHRVILKNNPLNIKLKTKENKMNPLPKGFAHSSLGDTKSYFASIIAQLHEYV